jgi:hypothetical protein
MEERSASGALAAWSRRALRPCELPTGIRVLVRLPDVSSMLTRDVFPGDLRALAQKYASEGIDVSKLDEKDLKRFVLFTYELISKAVRYVATPESGAWDAFLRTGADPSAEGWEPVTLTAQFLAEGDFDQGDLEALGQIVGRQKTTNEITAVSRFDRGLARLDEEETAIAGDDVVLDDFASLRRQPDGAPDRAHGEDVLDEAERPSRRRRSGSRVRS